MKSVMRVLATSLAVTIALSLTACGNNVTSSSEETKATQLATAPVQTQAVTVAPTVQPTTVEPITVAAFDPGIDYSKYDEYGPFTTLYTESQEVIKKYIISFGEVELAAGDSIDLSKYDGWSELTEKDQINLYDCIQSVCFDSDGVCPITTNRNENGKK